jgi:hypothetical protein
LNAKQGAFVGALKQFSNGKATPYVLRIFLLKNIHFRDEIRDCIRIVEKTRSAQSVNLVNIAKKWANEIGVFF